MTKKQTAGLQLPDDPVVKLERQVAELENRVSELEHRLSDASGPVKRVISPQIAWLRENRELLKEKHPGQWIAVTEEGLHGHADSLGELHQQMKEKGIDDATFVQVTAPLVPR